MTPGEAQALWQIIVASCISKKHPWKKNTVVKKKDSTKNDNVESLIMMGLTQLLQISTCVVDKADNTSNSYFQHPRPPPVYF